MRGIIFHGPAGTGKTLLGKTLAAELSRLDDGKGKFAFFYHKGTECYSKYVGETEAKLRAIFANAEAKKPAIIFMDEIDGICRVRDESGEFVKIFVKLDRTHFRYKIFKKMGFQDFCLIWHTRDYLAYISQI